MALPEHDPVQPVELATLFVPESFDVAQAEAWASSVVATIDDVDGLVAALCDDGSVGSVGLLAALGAVVDSDDRSGIDECLAASIDRGIDPPPWLDAVGTACPVEAWRVSTDDGTVLAIGWAHDDGTGHTMLIDIADGAVTGVRFGPARLVDSLLGEREAAGIIEESMSVEDVRAELASALGDPVVADEETWANVAIARARFRRLGIEGEVRFAEPVRCFAGVEPDPDTADRCIAILGSALGADAVAGPTTGDEERVIAQVARRVRPLEVVDATPLEARLLTHLEWADWLGAVIGLVRAGIGSGVAPEDLVAHVNRCPEVTTTVPKREVPEIAACFDAAMAQWARLGVVDEQGLTETGRRILPRVLVKVARRERAAVEEA